jgi:NAD(P)H-dependent FMN reductase
MPKHVYIVVGSMRANRIGPEVAAWVRDVLPAAAFTTELVDLNDWPLPLSDEPAIPAGGVYAQEHTKAWSRKIAAADVFVFVTPQYNWGYPASLKNALDRLGAGHAIWWIQPNCLSRLPDCPSTPSTWPSRESL